MTPDTNNSNKSISKKESKAKFEQALFHELESEYKKQDLIPPKDFDQMTRAAMEEFEQTKLPYLLQVLDEEDPEKRKQLLQERGLLQKKLNEDFFQTDDLSLPEENPEIVSGTFTDTIDAISDVGSSFLKRICHFFSSKKRTALVAGISVMLVVIAVFVVQSTTNGSNNPVISDYSSPSGGSGQVADIADRTEAVSANQILEQYAEKFQIPTLQLLTYNDAAIITDQDFADTTLLLDILFGEHTVHVQFLKLNSSDAITTTLQHTHISDVTLHSDQTAKIYEMDSTVDSTDTSYYAYVSQGAYLILFGTDMDFDEFCDFLKDLSVY